MMIDHDKLTAFKNQIHKVFSQVPKAAECLKMLELDVITVYDL